LPLLGRRRRRACRPRASVVGYLLSPLPSLAICWSPPPSRLSPPRFSCGYLCAPFPRLPSVGRRRRRACRHCASVGGYLLSPFPSFATYRLRYRCVLRPRPPVVGYLLFAPLSCARLFFYFSSTKRKENRGAAMQDTRFAIRIEQQTTHNIDPRITRSTRMKLKSRCRLV